MIDLAVDVVLAAVVVDNVDVVVVAVGFVL